MFNCFDCGINTDKIGEYYMVNFDLWNTIVEKPERMLCIGCLEERLGRELVSSDFTDCPLNRGFGTHFSERLKKRLGSVFDRKENPATVLL